MSRILAIIFTLSLLLPAANAAPPGGFTQRVEKLRREFGAPGIAIAIVENGQTTLARGYGVRKLGEPGLVDAETIFPTGSTGKAFTAAALAQLVDQGRIRWDDPVIDHMPWFRMYDPYVTREMTVRDLLVHRSGLGLGAGDLMYVPRSNRSRRDTVRGLAHIRPSTGFRYGYAYDNVLYVVAGQLIEEVTGQTWEDYTAEHLLRRAGMNDSTSDNDSRFAYANRAFPHARLNGGIRGTGDQELLDEREELGRNASPAGGLCVSARDMTRWLGIQLAQGQLPEGGQLFSAESAREMWTPVTIIPVTPLPEAVKAAQPGFDSYALGWVVRDYQGARVIQHGGGVFGSITSVVLIPERNTGFAIMINSEDVALLRGLTYELMDHYLGKPFRDWPAAWAEVQKQRLEKGLQALKSQAAEPVDIGPSLPLANYAGDYVDPWYGHVKIRSVAGALTIDFTPTPRMQGSLEHWQYDTFITRFDDGAIEPAFLTFALDADGSIDRMTMKAVSPLADFSYDYHDLLFEPVEPAQ